MPSGARTPLPDLNRERNCAGREHGTTGIADLALDDDSGNPPRNGTAFLLMIGWIG